MSVREAAQEIGISERALQRRIRTGIVRAQRVGARVWVIPLSEVDRLRGSGRLKPGPKPRTRDADV